MLFQPSADTGYSSLIGIRPWAGPMVNSDLSEQKHFHPRALSFLDLSPELSE